MSKPYRFIDIREGRATVVDRATGAVIGQVEYREKSYNLRRHFVARWWNAITPEGRKIADPGTRGDAAHMLLVHSKFSPAVRLIREAAARIAHTDHINFDAARLAARSLVEEAIALGADFKLTDEALTVGELYGWCKAQETP